MAGNRVVHFEIPANEPEALTKFYSTLFGWNFQKAPIDGPEYWTCDTGSEGPGINGAIMQRQNPQQPLMNYASVASIDAAIEKATALGASAENAGGRHGSRCRDYRPAGKSLWTLGRSATVKCHDKSPAS